MCALIGTTSELWKTKREGGKKRRGRWGKFAFVTASDSRTHDDVEGGETIQATREERLIPGQRRCRTISRLLRVIKKKKEKKKSQVSVYSADRWMGRNLLDESMGAGGFRESGGMPV